MQDYKDTWKEKYKVKSNDTEFTELLLQYCRTLVWGTAFSLFLVGPSWNTMAHGDAREGKWRGNWRMDWLASTLHTTSELGVSSITTADAHTTAASSRLNWRPRRFKWTRTFRRKTKSGFCACAITFQTQSITDMRTIISSTAVDAKFLFRCCTNMKCQWIFQCDEQRDSLLQHTYRPSVRKNGSQRLH